MSQPNVPSQSPSGEPRRPRAVINLMDLAPGTRVLLADGATAEIVMNPRDGAWLQVRYVADTSSSREGAEELVFADDVREILT